MTKYSPIDSSRIKTYSLAGRKSKVSVSDCARPGEPGMSIREYLDRLPNFLAASDLREVIARVAQAVDLKRPVILALGAHVIKVGLSPLVIDLMERGIVSLVALNGAGIIHDFELAFCGFTSEDVESVIGDGKFGMARETAEMLNASIREGADKNIGLGLAVGEMIEGRQLPHRNVSILAAGVRQNIPVTVHVALGTDIIHMHPEASGEAIGKASLLDFQVYASAVSDLAGGVYFNVGSAVILPEIFLKAISLARNLGHDVSDFTTINMDFIRHYRPQINVVGRPVKGVGRGITLIGHHEIMFPLLCAGIVDALGGRGA